MDALSLRFGLVGVALSVAYHVFFVGWVLLRPRRFQSSSLAWILLIVIVPFVGGLAFLLFGQVWADRSRAHRHRDIAARVRAYSQAVGVPEVPGSRLPEDGQGLATLAFRGGEMPLRPGNSVTLHSESDEVIRMLARDIDASTDHCHLLTYIYLDDGSGRRIADALLRAAARGVSCRVLVDSVGSRDFLRSSLARELRAGGVDVQEALRTRFAVVSRGRFDIRNHRKLAVLDGTVGWTGSQNIADAAFAPKPEFAPWVDCMLRIEGPLVHDLQSIFVQDWYMESREGLERVLDVSHDQAAGGVVAQLMPTGVNSPNDILVHVIQAGIHVAREEVVVTTPYFVPDEGTLAALVTAASRGVSTKLVVPRRNDSPLVAAASRSYYAVLLAAGAEIYEFTEGLLHAKTFTVDGRGALVGSANLDRRSFEINFELSVLLYNRVFAGQIRALQQAYMDQSVRIDAEIFEARSKVRRVLENACGILGPLL